MTSLRFNDQWRIRHWSCGASRGHLSSVLNAERYQALCASAAGLRNFALRS